MSTSARFSGAISKREPRGKARVRRSSTGLKRARQTRQSSSVTATARTGPGDRGRRRGGDHDPERRGFRQRQRRAPVRVRSGGAEDDCRPLRRAAADDPLVLARRRPPWRDDAGGEVRSTGEGGAALALGAAAIKFSLLRVDKERERDGAAIRQPSGGSGGHA